MQLLKTWAEGKLSEEEREVATAMTAEMSGIKEEKGAH
jgi:hypothetical protein